MRSSEMVCSVNRKEEITCVLTVSSVDQTAAGLSFFSLSYGLVAVTTATIAVAQTAVVAKF